MATAKNLYPTSLPILLNCHSHFSFGAAVSSPRTLVETCARAGFQGLALTDTTGVYGAVELHQAALEQTDSFTPIIGATVPLTWGKDTFPLVLLCASRHGYAQLNALLSRIHLEAAVITLEVLQEHQSDLFCLTGPRAGFIQALLERREVSSAQGLLQQLKGIYGDGLFVQLFHDAAPGDAQRGRILRRFAMDQGVAVVAAPEIRYARAALFPLFDALTCARLKITVEQDHPARGLNDAQHPHDPQHWATVFPYPEALGNAATLMRECTWKLLPDTLIPPLAKVPANMSAQAFLEMRVRSSASETYHSSSAPISSSVGSNQIQRWKHFETRLTGELEVIKSFELADFFLVAAEVTDYCRSRGILASGRGSAAGSLVCYLLGITTVDPLEQGLLFERFLYAGKKSMPDVDIDIASERRREVIAWVEQRFGHAREAMAANKITYRLPSALQDLGRALGLPPTQLERLSKSLGRDFRHLRPHRARAALQIFDEVLGDAAVKEVLLKLLEQMERGQVRHMAPHSGGVVLARDALYHYTPLERSSGGIQLLQFDKDDLEALGLIKLDLLGLRMLSALEQARNFVLEEGRWLDLYDMPDDRQIWHRIARGDTMGLFQIESPAQTATVVKLQPSSLTMLAHQIALIRPGPIQSNTVHPFIRRARGQEAVTYLHPRLEPILQSTLGVILYQEQQLRIAKHFAGYSWTEADHLRKRISSQEEEGDLDQERSRFIQGAMQHSSASLEQAIQVFEAVAAFSGFGFAQSHAVAFSHHCYASAWMRQYHPAAFLAGLLEADPGMWARSTLAQDAQNWGVRLLALDLNHSGVRFRPQWTVGKQGVRLPFHAVDGISREAGVEITLERYRNGKYHNLEDFYTRVNLDQDAFLALIRAGALEACGWGTRRSQLFTLETLCHAFAPGRHAILTPDEPVPNLVELEPLEGLGWDRELKGLSESGLHPMDLLAGELAALQCIPLEQAVYQKGQVRTAGLIISKQKPPTAQGFAFYVLEAGATRVQTVISPVLWSEHTRLLRDARALIVEGEIMGQGQAFTLRVERLSALPLEVYPTLMQPEASQI
jgi:error-prone DNA polymerase